MQRQAVEKGLGDAKALCKVYIANTPNMPCYQKLTEVQALVEGDIQAIGLACGNGWRKVFNVYAKLLYALNRPNFVSLSHYQNWQQFRDQALLQAGSNTSLLFSAPESDHLTAKGREVHIVMGKGYANSLALHSDITWIDNYFAINPEKRLIVCPYFDYRQLSNAKIIQLVTIIHSLLDEQKLDVA
ncbi:DUF6942 family protein [Paraglaciecola aestuariivivens]